MFEGEKTIDIRPKRGTNFCYDDMRSAQKSIILNIDKLYTHLSASQTKKANWWIVFETVKESVDEANRADEYVE